ncbi:MAG: carbohydrate-binding family 9-like protein [Planctomycetota bacterium]|nr:carbohydrate-binding family 9-like protein [Planctomycetota bacterium]
MSEPVPLCGRIAGTPWARGCVVRVDNYPWHVGGSKQPTTVRLLYDQEAIYAQFRCRDRHIHCRTTRLNGPVCKDSCVEFFAATEPQARPDYFNLEVNCCGVFHIGFGPSIDNRRLISPALAERIDIAASVPGPTKNESGTDRAWWVAAAVPFDVLSELTGRRVRPHSGDVWRGNFYRCGGNTDPQFACWNWIDSRKPDFHVPEFFGQLHFA